MPQKQYEYGQCDRINSLSPLTIVSRMVILCGRAACSSEKKFEKETPGKHGYVHWLQQFNFNNV